MAPTSRLRRDGEDRVDAALEPARRQSVGVLLLVTMLVATTVVATTIGLSFRWSSQRATSDARKDAYFQAQLAADGVDTYVRNALTSLGTAPPPPHSP